MSKIRNLLTIDDQYDEVKDALITMSNQLKGDGYMVNLFYINPKSKAFEKKDAPVMDTDAVFKAIKKSIKENAIHIIACDYTLGNDIDGIMVLSKIKNEFHFKGESILFSTKIDKLLNEILKSKLSFEERKAKLKKLITCNSVDFPSRAELSDVLKGIIRNTKFGEMNIRQEILKWLDAFEDHAFKVPPKLERKKLGNIADAMENETALGIDFQKIFVEQAISIMIQLNQLPPNE